VYLWGQSGIGSWSQGGRLNASLNDMARLGGSYRPAVVELLFSSPPGRFDGVDFTSLQSIERELLPFVLALCLGRGLVIALIAVPYLIGRRHGQSGAPPRADAAITAFVVFCTLGLWDSIWHVLAVAVQ
jgi:hypothetical protein